MDDYIFKKYYTQLPPIWQIRSSCGFSMKELAFKMGVTEMTLWRWNGGATISIEARIKLKEILDIFGGKDEQ